MANNFEMNSSAPTLAEEKEIERSPSPTPVGSLKEKRRDADGSITEKEEEEGSLRNTTLAEDGEPALVYPTGFRLAMIICALVLSIFLVSLSCQGVYNCKANLYQVALDMTIIATAIPKITDEFKGIDLISWYGAAFFLTVGAFQSTWGKAYKYFPLKLTFLLSIFIFELGSLICGMYFCFPVSNNC